MGQSVPVKGVAKQLYPMAVRLTLMYSFPLQNEAIPGVGTAEDDQIKLVDRLHINITTVYNITLNF